MPAPRSRFSGEQAVSGRSSPIRLVQVNQRVVETNQSGSQRCPPRRGRPQTQRGRCPHGFVVGSPWTSRHVKAKDGRRGRRPPLVEPDAQHSEGGHASRGNDHACLSPVTEISGNTIPPTADAAYARNACGRNRFAIRRAAVSDVPPIRLRCPPPRWLGCPAVIRIVRLGLLLNSHTQDRGLHRHRGGTYCVAVPKRPVGMINSMSPDRCCRIARQAVQ